MYTGAIKGGSSMEASKQTETKRKLRSAAYKAAGTVTAAGMLLNVGRRVAIRCNAAYQKPGHSKGCPGFWYGVFITQVDAYSLLISSACFSSAR